MKENFDDCLEMLLKHEGGYVNHPKDPGGETNLGVTRKVWEEWIGKPAAPDAMKKLTVKDVAPLYKKMYWDKVRGDDLPQGVDYAVFDFAVNAGPGRAAKFLQQSVGATPDGAIGPGTMALVAKATPTDILQKFAQQKEAFYNSLAEKNPTQQKFLKGWLSRVAHVQTAASSMLA